MSVYGCVKRKLEKKDNHKLIWLSVVDDRESLLNLTVVKEKDRNKLLDLTLLRGAGTSLSNSKNKML